MKSIIGLVLLIASLAGGVWWLAKSRNERIAAENQAAETAAAETLRTQRLDLFGEAALADEISWTETGLGLLTVEEGTGTRPVAGGFVTFNYQVRLKDGTIVDESAKPLETQIGRMIPGVSSGLQMMKRGGRAILFIPPRLGYGGSAYGRIPPKSGLIFSVDLL
jgi:FKBP-type peptidyl-prolyl cis-trans isomerase